MPLGPHMIGSDVGRELGGLALSVVRSDQSDGHVACRSLA